jgi:hypothetical protein
VWSRYGCAMANGLRGIFVGGGRVRAVVGAVDLDNFSEGNDSLIGRNLPLTWPSAPDHF